MRQASNESNISHSSAENIFDVDNEFGNPSSNLNNQNNSNKNNQSIRIIYF
jgi:hypothetical protein